MYGDVDEDDEDALRNGPVRKEQAHGDIEAQIQQELRALQEPRQARFVALDTDTECLCFIQCRPPVDSFRLLKRVLEDVRATGATRSRFVQRVSPVRVMCRADTESIRAAAAGALAPAFGGTEARSVRDETVLTQYRIEPRIRAHTSLSRDVLIPLVASCVPSSAAHRVDLARPDVIIVVEVLRNVCGIGTLDAYAELGKWNVQTLAEHHRTEA